ncbi:DUF624 domain-containing protein [Mycoplasmatota bacterium]|nr:DUF624 domain-containing protein [Mycoplasmatota bacterium]
MNFEKYIDSKLYHFFDKAFNLIVINLLLILISILGLGVFTLFPALAATYVLLQCESNDIGVSLIKSFYIVMKKDYIKLQKLFIMIVLIIGIFAFNTMFFYEYAISQNGSMFHFVGLFVILSIDLLIIGMLLHLFPVYMYFNKLKPIGIIKFSTLMVFAYPFRTILVVLISFGWILLISFQPPTIPFISVTIPIYIYLKLFNSTYKKLTNNDTPIENYYFS